jgi:hypothetical protein
MSVIAQSITAADASPLQDALTYDSGFLNFELIILNCPGHEVQAKRVLKREF